MIVLTVALALLPAAPALGQTFRDCDTCPEMVMLPGGSFRMGAVSGMKHPSLPDRSGGGIELPVRTVQIRPFAVGRYEVLVGEYNGFANETRRQGKGCYASKGTSPFDEISTFNPGFEQTSSHPVVCVSHQDAQAYVAWLSRKTGKRYRLLTEAEWEYAARAGTVTQYSWGNEVGRDRASCDGCGSAWDLKGTAPAGSFAPNAWGLYDMHGNAWEWVTDCWKASYRGSAPDGSAWMEGDCGARIFRGGSWGYEARFLRSAFRTWYDHGNRSDNGGFRVARDP